jgi:hypothetical protein
MTLKNGTAVLELPKRVSSGMEHVCYLFLLILEHVRYLSNGCTDVCMYHACTVCVSGLEYRQTDVLDRA